MKVLLDIKDSKADFVLELLNDLPFVKFEILIPQKNNQKKNLVKAVKELNLIKAGKKKSVSLNSFLDK